MVKLRYVDTRPIYFPKLTKYPGGVALPNDKGESIIDVTEGEAKSLLKQMNGKMPCYEIIEELKTRKKDKEEILNNEE